MEITPKEYKIIKFIDSSQKNKEGWVQISNMDMSIKINSSSGAGVYFKKLKEKGLVDSVSCGHGKPYLRRLTTLGEYELKKQIIKELKK